MELALRHCVRRLGQRLEPCREASWLPVDAGAENRAIASSDWMVMERPRSLIVLYDSDLVSRKVAEAAPQEVNDLDVIIGQAVADKASVIGLAHSTLRVIPNLLNVRIAI